MTTKIEDIGSASVVLKNTLETIQAEVEDYDPTFTEDWITDTWDPAITDALNITSTKGLIKEHKDVTKERNFDMDTLIPISKDLEYKIKLCIKAGTITNTLGSFGLADFRKNIREKKFDGFHLAYVVTIGKVNDNHTALIAKGFTADKITSITTMHDKAQTKQNLNLSLVEQINNLSESNQDTINIVMGYNTMVMDVIKAYANSIDDKELEKRVSWSAIMKHVRQTPVKKPRNRKLKVNGSIVFRTNMDDKNLLQMTLLTDVKVIVYRTKLKSTVLTDGLELPYNELWEGKKEDLPGVGEYIKITNLNTLTKAVVRCFELDVQVS